MTAKFPNIYLLPAILLCLHLTFAISSFYFYKSFQADLASRSAELPAMKSRLQQIDETQLNKDLVLAVMETNLADSETFMVLFRTLAQAAFLMACFSAASLVQICRYRLNGG